MEEFRAGLLRVFEPALCPVVHDVTIFRERLIVMDYRLAAHFDAFAGDCPPHGAFVTGGAEDDIVSWSIDRCNDYTVSLELDLAGLIRRGIHTHDLQTTRL